MELDILKGLIEREVESLSQLLLNGNAADYSEYTSTLSQIRVYEKVGHYLIPEAIKIAQKGEDNE